MYNFYSRRITDYKIFLVKLFPIDSRADAERKSLSEYMKRKHVRTTHSNKKRDIRIRSKNWVKAAIVPNILEINEHISITDANETLSEDNDRVMVNVSLVFQR